MGSGRANGLVKEVGTNKENEWTKKGKEWIGELKYLDQMR